MDKKKQTEQQSSQEFNVMDIVWYLLSNWKWYILALAVCLALAYNRYIHSERTYYSSIDVLINDPSNSDGVVGLSRYSSVFNAVNIANELHMLRSKELLEKMEVIILVKLVHLLCLLIVNLNILNHLQEKILI